MNKIGIGELTLRPVETQDLPIIWRQAYDTDEPEWMKWNGPYFNDPKYSLEEFVEAIGPSWVDSPRTYVACYKEEVVGVVSWHWEDGKLEKWLEFGIVIFVHQLWNKGLGTEICKLWIHHIFEERPDLIKLGFTTWSGNDRMLKIGEKLGMKKEACIRSVRYWEGQYYDSVKYGLLRHEWLENEQFQQLKKVIEYS